MAVTRPFSSTVATVSSDELQTTAGLEALEGEIVAVSCTGSPPTASSAVSGVTVIPVTVCTPRTLMVAVAVNTARVPFVSARSVAVTVIVAVPSAMAVTTPF